MHLSRSSRRLWLGTRRWATALSRDESGNALVLTALMSLLVAVAVAVTFSIGHRTREKIKLQALADSASYSLAVGQARAFNYYALSNRAIISNYVAILSVHSHESYLTWFETLLKATAKSWELIRQRFQMVTTNPCMLGDCVGPCQPEVNVAGQIQDLFQFKGINNTGRGSFDWIHKRWHGRHAQWCGNTMQNGTRDHFNTAITLRTFQTQVHNSVRQMLQSDGQFMAQAVDLNVRAVPSAANVALTAYDRAVDNVTSTAGSQTHRDYDEALMATTWPHFLTKRSYIESPTSWWMHMNACKKAASIQYIYFYSIPSTALPEAGGNSLALSCVDWAAANGLTEDWISDGGDHPTFGEGPSAAAYTAYNYGASKAIGYVPSDGWNLNHQVVLTQYLGGSVGGAAADGGDVLAAMIHTWAHHHNGGDACKISASEFTRQDEGLGPGLNSVFTAPSHNHPFHQYSHHPDATHMGHTGAHNEVEGHRTPSNRPFFQGFMRFDFPKNDPPRQTLWNMPRAFSVVYKQPQNRVYPWDLNMNLGFQRGATLRTFQTAADTATNGMSAMSGALTYYHKPASEGDTDRYEPPSFWNPFWRAKLHPIWLDDARQALASLPAQRKILDSVSSPERMMNE